VVENGVNFVQICVNDQDSYGEVGVDAIVRINIANNFDDYVYAHFFAENPEIDCFTIDATAGRIWQLEAHVSDEDFGGGTVLQRIRGLKVYSDRANPTLFQGHGPFPVGATVHTYSFATDKYFVGLGVIYVKNPSGFSIPMGLEVLESTELLDFNYPALQNMVITVGDPNPTAYDLSTRWLPDTGICDTVGYTYNNFRGVPPYGTDPAFSTRWRPSTFVTVVSTGVSTWTPSYPLSSDR